MYIKKLKFINYLFLLFLLIAPTIYSLDLTIEKIEIINNRSISKAEILSFLQLRENKKVDVPTLIKIKDKLLNWGYFNSVEVNFKKNNNKVFITIKVKENPILENIKIYVNNHISVYYKKYITIKNNKPFNQKILENNIKALYKLPEISQISYKLSNSGEKNVILNIYITKKIVQSYYFGIYNFLDLSFGIEKLDLFFPFDIYLSLLYLNKTFIFPNLYLNSLFNIELTNKLSFFTNIPVSFLNDTISINFVPGLFLNLNKFSFSLFYNINYKLFSFHNTNYFNLKNLNIINKFEINYNPDNKNIFFTNSAFSFNNFYLSNHSNIFQITNTFIIPYLSIRGFKTLGLIKPYIINSKYSINYNVDFIFTFLYLNFFNFGLILSNDLIYLYNNTFENLYSTLGFGLYIEAGIKKILSIPIILEVFTNINNFNSYTIYFELRPFKIR